MSTQHPAYGWSLFADWAASWGRSALPAAHDDLVQFLVECPASRDVQVRRLREIIAAHREHGLPITAPTLTGERDHLWRDAKGLLDPQGSIAQAPKYRFPVGLVGRRDGFLLAVTGVLGFSREAARAIEGQDVQVTPGTVVIAGRRMAMEGAAATCPACAAARWLATIAPSAQRGRATYAAILDPTVAEPEEHDCLEPVGNDWKTGVPLLPSIDRWGALGTGESLSARAISTIVAARRIDTGFKEKVGAVVRSGGRFEHSSSAELAEAQDEVFDEVDRINREIEALLAEASGMRDHIDGFGDVPR
ncbi:hypothetical protein GCM10025867_47960 (plasmid) [Frondihabitans sucicola]|uniref:Uncharacterized protein n=1 Tax=Frondihabitans sucicola TaxID=1268041 RepID=A0ABM8GVQ8_9MICO|nr:hypothetical protein [Frondihabitans sucicola]BDZ52555.1 hypothetical protein GCM10025867_47960 [Frondihabitans sucicola]